MNQPDTAVRRATEQRRLQPEHVRSLLSHLDTEEATLRVLRQILEEVPADTASEPKQRAFRHRVEQALEHSLQMAQRRAILLDHVGKLSGLRPEQVTLSALIRASAPTTAASLVTARHRLNRIVRQIRQLTSVVAWVTQESRMINSLLLQELLGETSSSRYDSSGQRSLDPSTIRFETRS